MLKLGVLASGRGSNLQSIIDSIDRGELTAEIVVVISDREGAMALKRAEKHGIPAVYCNPDEAEDIQGFEQEMINILQQYQVELVVMAGFIRILSPYFISTYPYRVMNIHPSLLPSFPGLNAQQQALEYGVKLSGCTVHFADEGMDTGPIILQAAVPVKEGDSLEDLSERILAEEHRIYPRAIRFYIQDRLKIENNRVRVVP